MWDAKNIAFSSTFVQYFYRSVQYFFQLEQYLNIHVSLSNELCNAKYPCIKSVIHVIIPCSWHVHYNTGTNNILIMTRIDNRIIKSNQSLKMVNCKSTKNTQTSLWWLKCTLLFYIISNVHIKGEIYWGIDGLSITIIFSR